jgi:hypothetical protein
VLSPLSTSVSIRQRSAWWCACQLGVVHISVCKASVRSWEGEELGVARRGEICAGSRKGNVVHTVTALVRHHKWFAPLHQRTGDRLRWATCFQPRAASSFAELRRHSHQKVGE